MVYLVFTLYPFGHLGLAPLTFLFVLPFVQTIIFFVAVGLGAMTEPVSIIATDVEIGAKVDVPAWDAVTTQLPAFNKFKVEPVIEQASADVVEYITDAPLDAVAARVSVLAEISIFAGRVKVIVCGSLVTSNETL